MSKKSITFAAAKVCVVGKGLRMDLQNNEYNRLKQ